MNESLPITVVIFGASGDHPFDDSLRELLPLTQRVFVTRSRHPRAATSEALAQTVADLGYETAVAPDVPGALEAALDVASPDDLICVTGSIFTVVDAREAWFERNGLPLPPLDPEV